MTGTLPWNARHILVTGAAGTIGAAIVATLRGLGARVSAVDVRAGTGLDVCDVTDAESVRRAVDDAVRQHVLTDCVHAAGLLHVGDVLTSDLAEVRRVIDVNLISNFVVAQAVIPRLAEQSTFTVVASQAAHRGSLHWAAYCASKAGAVRIVESLAQEVGPRGIRVNALCPGSVDSPMMDRAIGLIAELHGADPAQIRQRYHDEVPLGRLATPQDIADACVLLMDPRAGFVTGVTLDVDGGEL